MTAPWTQAHKFREAGRWYAIVMVAEDKLGEITILYPFAFLTWNDQAGSNISQESFHGLLKGRKGRYSEKPILPENQVLIAARYIPAALRKTASE